MHTTAHSTSYVIALGLGAFVAACPAPVEAGPGAHDVAVIGPCRGVVITVSEAAVERVGATSDGGVVAPWFDAAQGDVYSYQVYLRDPEVTRSRAPGHEAWGKQVVLRGEAEVRFTNAPDAYTAAAVQLSEGRVVLGELDAGGRYTEVHLETPGAADGRNWSTWAASDATELDGLGYPVAEDASFEYATTAFRVGGVAVASGHAKTFDVEFGVCL